MWKSFASELHGELADLADERIVLLATVVIKFRTLPSENCALRSHGRNSRWMQFALTRQLAIVAGRYGLQKRHLDLLHVRVYL
jgi:hypothetical protein